MDTIKACQICGSTFRIVLFHQEFCGLSSGSFLHEYDVCVCDKCGFGFADGLPPAESFDRHYAEMSKWDYLESRGIEPESHSRQFEIVARRLLEFNIPKDTPVLDIGCSTGGMLAALKRNGFTNLMGLDPSLKCAELAKANYGINVFTGNVKELARLENNFGLVMLSGTLEHFYDPTAAIRDIRNRLIEGGLFYVNVPDASRFSTCFDAPYQQFSVEHILYFTRESLANLLAKNGFEAVSISADTIPYTRSFSYPVLEAIFKKSEPRHWKKENSTRAGLKDYIRVSGEVEDRIGSQIRSLIKTKEPILVWGVGTQTQRLIASVHLGEANIVAFIDSNPHYHGKMMAGRPIISPHEVKKHGEPILIGSIIFTQEIIAQIRHDLKLSNDLRTLGIGQGSYGEISLEVRK